MEMAAAIASLAANAAFAMMAKPIEPYKATSELVVAHPASRPLRHRLAACSEMHAVEHSRAAGEVQKEQQGPCRGENEQRPARAAP